MTERVAAEEGAEEISAGSMIELPRACVLAGEIAAGADFLSFGTNDLTQTAPGFSRDDAETKFLPSYLRQGTLESDPFETLDREGVGGADDGCCEEGAPDEAGHQDGHMWRARRRLRFSCVLPGDWPGLCVLPAVPGACGQAGGSAGCAC